MSWHVENSILEIEEDKSNSTSRNGEEDKMILILEDNVDLGYVMKNIFQTVFHEECFVTANIQDAILCLCTEDIRLVMSDIDLGAFSGLDFIRKIKKLKPHSSPPIVAFTAMSTGNRLFGEVATLCDAVYEKGSISTVEMCKQIYTLLK